MPCLLVETAVFAICMVNIMYKENQFIRHAPKMTCRQGSGNSCDDGIDGTICSAHGLTHACCSLTAVHAKHDVRVDMAGHGKRDLERPRPCIIGG
jgi:hypothetical protein